MVIVKNEKQIDRDETSVNKKNTKKGKNAIFTILFFMLLILFAITIIELFEYIDAFGEFAKYKATGNDVDKYLEGMKNQFWLQLVKYIASIFAYIIGMILCINKELEK